MEDNFSENVTSEIPNPREPCTYVLASDLANVGSYMAYSALALALLALWAKFLYDFGAFDLVPCIAAALYLVFSISAMGYLLGRLPSDEWSRTFEGVLSALLLCVLVFTAVLFGAAIQDSCGLGFFTGAKKLLALLMLFAGLAFLCVLANQIGCVERCPISLSPSQDDTDSVEDESREVVPDSQPCA